MERTKRRGAKQAKTSNRPLPGSANISQRNLDHIEEEKQQDRLVEAAERAASNLVNLGMSLAYHPTEPVPVQVIPWPLGEAPQPKEEDFDC